MLVLARKVGESIMIGDDVEVIVTDVHAGKVRLGIQAPNNIKIHRKEIWLDIKNADANRVVAPNAPYPTGPSK